MLIDFTTPVPSLHINTRFIETKAPLPEFWFFYSTDSKLSQFNTLPGDRHLRIQSEIPALTGKAEGVHGCACLSE